MSLRDVLDIPTQENNNLQMLENRPTIASNHGKSACLACSNKWCHSLRDSGSEQNVMGARWVVVYDLRSQKLMQFVFYKTCCVMWGNSPTQLAIPSMFGATKALRLGRRLEKLCGKPPRNSGRRLWQGLCLLSGDFGKLTSLATFSS